MTKDAPLDATEITIEELVDRLAPGTLLTLIFRSAQGTDCRRHRVVNWANTRVVRLSTLRPETEPFVDIVFWPGDRVYLLQDGFVLAFAGEIGSRYIWGHVT
jgi:hypothetical protein